MYGVQVSQSLDEMLDEMEREPIAENKAQKTLERTKVPAANDSSLSHNESSEPSKNYSFPVSQAQSARAVKGLGQRTVDELLQMLERLSSELDSAGNTRLYKGTARTLFCAVSLELNERDGVAPQFRPVRRLGQNKGHSNEESALSNDRQVIDLHWLYRTGKRNSIDHNQFADLFTQDQFDFELAAELSAKAWTADHKSANVLNLGDYEMLQLSWFRTKTVNDQWRNANKRMNGTIDRKLRAQTVREPAFAKHIDGLKKVWLVTHLAGQYGPVATARLYGWMTGQALAKSTWSGKVKTMNKRTGENL